ncbi:MAG: hypothetical protein LBQ75_03020 [Zoogloeaceae bacterium]|jgi:hypothetical protein|nr:hypothetical protein [Zoogloeaceae bacterium]
MIALIFLIIIAVWVALARLLWKLWRSTCEKTEGRWNLIITPVFALVALAWLAASFWYGGGQIFYYNAKVKRMCAIDGGINVYETVKLPPERFDQWDNVKLPSQEKAKPSDDYFYVSDDVYIETSSDSVTLRRSGLAIVRRSDGKTLGEVISYHRRGGDIPFVPAHPSSFRCPTNPFKLNLGKAVFLKETVK